MDLANSQMPQIVKDEGRTTGNTQENSDQQLYVPERLKIPVLPDFLEVLEKLKGQQVRVEVHGGSYNLGVLREIFNCNGQLVLEVYSPKENAVWYMPYGAIREITPK
jgi:hypothetical protein